MKKIIVSKVRDLGPQFVDNNYRMVGQDGAYSISLKDGSALWFFGDTLIGARAPSESLWFMDEQSIKPEALTEGWNKIEKIVHNTGAIVWNTTGAGGLDQFKHIIADGNGLKQLIPLLPGENHASERIWCFHGHEIEKTLYLFFQKIEIIEDKNSPFPVAFRVIGSGLAKGSSMDWEFQRIKQNDFGIVWPADQPQFGAVILPDKSDEYFYIYGVLRDDDSGTQNVYVARVLQSEVEDFFKYEYLADLSPGWSNNVKDAAIVFSGPPNELSVSFNNHLGCYLSVHSQDITGAVMGRTAPNPWGPWSEAVELYRVKFPQKRLPYPVLTYAAKEHPELSGDAGRTIYITYIEFEEYYPHLIEIELA